jgi:DNA repair protein RadC
MVKETSAIYRIKDLPVTDRPRERLMEVGADSLQVVELLAILLRTGVKGENAVQVAGNLLNIFHGLGGLHQATFQDVCEVHGVGPAKAAQIKAALALGNHLWKQGQDERPVIHSPADAADWVRFEMSGLAQEHLWVLVLDSRNRLVSTEKMYVGSINSSSARIGELFKAAIQRNAVSIIVVHNHPSGDPTPSPEDISITRAIVQAGKLLDIAVLDHLIIGHERFTSLKEKGLGFG